ncbi:MAG: hypothetical protein ABI208_06790, partial [Ginsengibacter sp.]
MYLPIPNGTCINIQGLDCWIPPEGYVYNVLTKQVEFRGVFERSKDISKQHWERFVYPDWYKEVTKKEDEYLKKKKEDDAPFYDKRYEEYKKQEWDRRLNGFWFMNKGKPVFISPFYYMLLQWFQIDIGYAKFTKPHLYKIYFLQYCIEDPLCMGMIDITKRRFLKTFIGGLFLLEYVTRTKMVNGALQSKTGADAKKVFGKAVVYPFRKFPRFFRPEYDMSLGINPKTEIRFQQTNIRGKKAEDSIDKDELGSMIDWGSADPIHYDGSKVSRYFSDEWGKTTEANIYDRHEVIRYCLLDEEGKIIGKALYSTTVEKLESDKDGVQQAARDLWNASNQNRREKNGRTQSGLYRFFQTADEAKNFDIYGDPDVEKTISEILEDRESVQNNPRSLTARMRKEPRTIDEAFSIDGDSCIFNVVNIARRKKELENYPKNKRSIWFYRDEDNQKVKWRDILPKEKDFCWQVSENFDLTYENANKFETEGSLRKPARTSIGAIAIDGYSNSQGGEKWGSRASAWIGLKANGNQRKKAIAHLYGRPNEKDTLHEQVMLASEFLGFQSFYEHNSDDYYSYFKGKGKLMYLGNYPINLIDPIKLEETVRHKGVPTTPYSLTKQTDLGVSYFETHIEEIDFENLFPDAEIFDPNNRTKFDTTVSFLILISVLSDTGMRHIPPPKEPLIRSYGGVEHNMALAVS